MPDDQRVARIAATIGEPLLATTVTPLKRSLVLLLCAVLLGVSAPRAAAAPACAAAPGPRACCAAERSCCKSSAQQRCDCSKRTPMPAPAPGTCRLPDLAPVGGEPMVMPTAWGDDDDRAWRVAAPRLGSVPGDRARHLVLGNLRI